MLDCAKIKKNPIPEKLFPLLGVKNGAKKAARHVFILGKIAQIVFPLPSR